MSTVNVDGLTDIQIEMLNWLAEQLRRKAQTGEEATAYLKRLLVKQARNEPALSDEDLDELVATAIAEVRAQK